VRNANSGPYLRVGGRVRLADGAELLWSVAEGARGRRWRAVAGLDESITHVLLLELDRTGRPTRLELSTPAGLLTLHPEQDEGSIHGNVVAADGVRPLAFGWSPEHELLVVERPIGLAAALHRRRASVGVGGRAAFPALVIGAGLRVVPGEHLIERIADDRWRVVDPASGVDETLSVDADGLIGAGERWPLEP